MFGRVRASSSSPDELERPTAKLLKHDSLSVYESTLLKLRVGSQHAQSTSHVALCPENEVMDTEADTNSALDSPQEEPMAVEDAAPASATTLESDSNSHDMVISKPHSRRNPSVSYLFAMYKGIKDPSSHDNRMTMEVNCCSSISPNSGNYHYIVNVDQQACRF